MRKYLVVLAVLLAVLAVWRFTQIRPLPQRANDSVPIPALIIGQASAKLTVTVYGDYGCKSCGDFYRVVLPQIERDFVAKGLVKIQWRNDAYTSESQLAAQAAHCAGEQNFFPQFHDQIINRQLALTTENFKGAAAQNDFANLEQFDSCLKSGKYMDVVKLELKQAQQAGDSPNSILIGNQSVIGLPPYTIIKPIIEAQL